MAGFNLGRGSGNALIDSVAVGNLGNKGATGFIWPESGSGLWTFKGCVAHNNKTDGLFVWQNNVNPHVIEDFVAFRNRYGIEHGAYNNAFAYERCTTFENGRGMLLYAVSASVASGPLRWTDSNFADGIQVVKHTPRARERGGDRRTRPARRSWLRRAGGRAREPMTSSGRVSSRRIGPSRPCIDRASTACSARTGPPTASTPTEPPRRSLRSPEAGAPARRA